MREQRRRRKRRKVRGRPREESSHDVKEVSLLSHQTVKTINYRLDIGTKFGINGVKLLGFN